MNFKNERGNKIHKLSKTKYIELAVNIILERGSM